jgi:hypothetical protein
VRRGGGAGFANALADVYLSGAFVLDAVRPPGQAIRELFVLQRTRAKYDARRTAIKWMLVSCFGYMGFLFSGELAKLRREMTFQFVYMQMTRPSFTELLPQFPLQRAEFGNFRKVAFVNR